MLKLLAIPLLLTSLLFVSGCDKLPEGFGRRPYILVSKKQEFTPEQMAVLQGIAKEHPALARAIIGRNHEFAEAIATYNRSANEFNRKLLINIGYSKEEAECMEPMPESP